MIIQAIKKRKLIIVFTFVLSFVLQHTLPIGRAMGIASLVLSFGLVLWANTYEKDLNASNQYLGCFNLAGLTLIVILYSLISSSLYLVTCLPFSEQEICLFKFRGISIGNIMILFLFCVVIIYITRSVKPSSNLH